MNLSKLLNNLTKPNTAQKQQTPQNYNLSQNYYPQEAYDVATPSPQQAQANISPTPAEPQSSQNGLDIQSILPLLSKMNGGDGSGLNIASLLNANGGGAKSSNPLTSLTSILGTKKQDDSVVDLNKNSQLVVENFKKISDLDE